MLETPNNRSLSGVLIYIYNYYINWSTYVLCIYHAGHLFNHSHTHTDACMYIYNVHALVWHSKRVNEMGFWRWLYKKHIIMFLKKYTRTCRYINLPKWTLPFKCVHPWTPLNNVTGYWIYMCHTLSKFYLTFVWYQMIRYTHIYIVSCAHVNLIPDMQVI